MELQEYMVSILSQIDSSMPPYFNPTLNNSNPFAALPAAPQGYVQEPYSELADYLDKDDFTNLLGVLGQFAGKTGSGLLSFGENILNQFVFKIKNQKVPDIEEFFVPGQKMEPSGML